MADRKKKHAVKKHLHAKCEHCLHYCRVCDDIHVIKLSNRMIKTHIKFPFPYFFLHGELKNLMTTLYIDKDLQIRGVDVHELSDDDIFSKDQVKTITNTLVTEIERLQTENANLAKKINKLKKKINKN